MSHLLRLGRYSIYIGEKKDKRQNNRQKVEEKKELQNGCWTLMTTSGKLMVFIMIIIHRFLNNSNYSFLPAWPHFFGTLHCHRLQITLLQTQSWYNYEKKNAKTKLCFLTNIYPNGCLLLQIGHLGEILGLLKDCEQYSKFFKITRWHCLQTI